MSQSHLSMVERQFIKQNIYKRSKRYFDIAKLNSIEHHLEVSRRAPSCNQTIQTKVQGSFISSNELLNDKVNHDLSYFHKKREQQEQVQTNYTARTSRNGGLDMNKMLARSYYDKGYTPHCNQEQFNNFGMSHHRPKMSLDFTKFIGREQKNSPNNKSGREEPQELNSQRVGSIHQKMIFNQGNACLIDYKLQSKNKKQKLEESPTYDLSRIRRGEQLTKRKINPELAEFYNGNGKHEPSQLDNRLLHENQYFWKNVKAERERLKDFSTKKKKQIEISSRLQKILARKKLPHLKEQMCDEKFFRRNS